MQREKIWKKKRERETSLTLWFYVLAAIPRRHCEVYAVNDGVAHMAEPENLFWKRPAVWTTLMM